MSRVRTLWPSRDGENELNSSCGILQRWLKFNFVGGIGIGAQFAALFVLKGLVHLDYMLATALAVEAAVVHNFLWHEQYTWKDRVERSLQNSIPRLIRFNLTTGAVSILGNLLLMKALVGNCGMNYLVANAIAIALCSTVNFLVSDSWVFGRTPERR
jgi:putative flippase GtrA